MKLADIIEWLEDLEARITMLENESSPDPDPLELALKESGYEDLAGAAFVEGYMRAEEDLT